jgi:predicted metal-dependent hydrolase
MEKDILKIKTSRNNLEHLIFMVEGYLKTLAEQTIRDKVKEFAEVLEVFPEKCIVKTQKKRWGTCSSRRELRFNWKCIMLKDDLIDYIVVHELCHLKQMNHSSDFWNEVENRIPDYKSRRNALKKYIISLD